MRCSFCHSYGSVRFFIFNVVMCYMSSSHNSQFVRRILVNKQLFYTITLESMWSSFCHSYCSHNVVYGFLIFNVVIMYGVWFHCMFTVLYVILPLLKLLWFCTSPVSENTYFTFLSGFQKTWLLRFFSNDVSKSRKKSQKIIKFAECQ